MIHRAQIFGEQGRAPDGDTYARGTFHLPTVLSNVEPRSLVMREETFGPVAAICRYRGLDEVIAAANDTFAYDVYMRRTTPRPPRTLAEYAYEELRAAILQGTFAPGERLDQSKIAERYGISRTPLREVLRRLHSDGLVIIQSHRGAQVAKLGVSDIAEIYEIRAQLESYAAGRAVENWSQENESELRRIYQRMEAAKRRSDPEGQARTHFDFHAALYRRCGNTQMLQLIQDLMRKTDWYRRASLAIPQRADLSLEHHREILDAYAARDTDRVRELVRTNIVTAAQPPYAQADPSDS